ncbi:hypothetical protein QQ045_003352 [Rhodiola kirilowii]
MASSSSQKSNVLLRIVFVLTNSVKYSAINCRKHSALLTDFGAVNDGKTLNTKAFEAAIANLSKLAHDGGAQLIVPPGKWLTGSIHLTASHFTRFLHKDAQIIASMFTLNPYGIKVGIPSQHIVIKRLTCFSPFSAAIALGSEMSGGIHDARAMDLNLINTESGVRIKTGRDRGNYVKDIFVKNAVMNTMKYVFWMTGNYGGSNGSDPSTIPVVQNINYKDMVAKNVMQSASLAGIEGHPFKDICISNVTIGLARKAKKLQWACSDVIGATYSVSPQPCALLPENKIGEERCAFPTDRLPIEDVHSCKHVMLESVDLDFLIPKLK